MKEMVSVFPSGDWRRVMLIDATGMNASNFDTFAVGNGATGFAKTHKWYFDYPKEFYKMLDNGLMQSLPRHKEELEYEKPAYVVDVKFSMTGQMVMGMMCPQ